MSCCLYCRNDVVPIVYGASREDYEQVAPSNSFIHVDDYESPLQLAQYLLELNGNSTKYNEYFKWKNDGEFINTKFFCRLCLMLHAANNFSVYYDDLNNWWKGNGVCNELKPGELWMNWKKRQMAVPSKSYLHVETVP
jgi:glycoprotein 3-alpha-L-fucosyltransferase